MNLRKIRKQIHYHSAQRWGVTVILLIIFGVLIMSQYSAWNHVTKEYDNEEYAAILKSLNTEATKRDKSIKKRSRKSSGLIPIKFNPNTITKDGLMNMGIKESIAKSWTNYTSKGGKFYTSEDLKKLYVMNDYLYDKLKSYVDIPKQNREKRQYPNQHKKTKQWAENDTKSIDYEYNRGQKNNYQSVKNDSIIDTERKEYNANFKAARKSRSSGLADDYIIALNTTDSTELQMLDGIGPVLSSRIIKYRDLLGGFHNMNQLLEVYGVKTALVSNIIDKINFEGNLTKIDLNKITVDSLVKHPYFDYPTANIFINYRNHHGPYRDIKDVKKIIAIKEYWLDEVAPYFSYSIEE